MRHGLRTEDFQTNRRGEARTPLSRPIDFMAIEGPGAWQFVRAKLTDCSAHGLSLIAPHPLPPGAQFLVKLLLATRVTLVVYKVQNSQAVDGGHRIGARFHGLAAGGASSDPEQIMATLLEEGRPRS